MSKTTTDGIVSSTQLSDKEALVITNKLFVYGTLQSGYGNNKWCLGGATSLGSCVTKGGYLLSGDGIPFMNSRSQFGELSEEEESCFLPVEGELFEIDSYHLAQCDSLEGHPTMYKRELIETNKGKCWAYVWQHEPSSTFCNTTQEGDYKW